MESKAVIYEDRSEIRPLEAEHQFDDDLPIRTAEGWRLVGLASPRPGVLVAAYERTPRKGSPG